jgi:HAD superfamily hydrolase (TIGR01509 family)
MDKKDIKGIIFDLDGTLIDTEWFQWQGWVFPLKELGVELSEQDYLKYAGRSGSIIEEELIKKYDLDVEKGFLLEKKRKLLEKWFKEEQINLMPYAEEAINFVKERNYKMALCSGGPREEIELKLERTNLLHYFDIIVSNNEVKRSKPFPDIYLYAFKEIGLDPEECLTLEDTQYGLQSAKDAGSSCFVIPNKFSSSQDFSRADKVLNSLKDFIDYLN